MFYSDTLLPIRSELFIFYWHPGMTAYFQQAKDGPSTDWWVNEICGIYSNRILLSHKKKEILFHVTTQMNTESIIIREINQPLKEYYVTLLTWDTLNRKRQRQREQCLSEVGGGGYIWWWWSFYLVCSLVVKHSSTMDEALDSIWALQKPKWFLFRMMKE